MAHAILYIILKKAHNISLALGEILVADISSDCETWGNRNSYQIHFCKVCALATEQISHICPTFSLTITKGIDSFFTHVLFV